MGYRQFLKNRDLNDNYESKTILLLFVGTTLAYLITSPPVYGYRGGDQTNQIPYIKNTINDAYLANDWYIEAATGITSPRYYYNHIVAIPADIIGLEVTIHILYLFSMLGAIFGIWIFTTEIFNDKLAGVLVVAFFLSGHIQTPFVIPLPPFEPLANKGLINSILKPSQLSLPFILFGLIYSVRRSYRTGFVLFGISTLIHPTTGVLLAGTTAFCSVVTELTEVRDIELDTFYELPWDGVLLYTIVSGFILVPLAASNLFTDVGFRATYLNAWVRHTEFHIPSSWSVVNIILAIVIVSILSWILLSLRRELIADNRKRIFSITFVASLILVMIIGGFIFTELLPISAVINLQPLRVEYFVYLILFGGASKAIIYYLSYFADSNEKIDVRCDAFPIIVIAIVLIGSVSLWTGGLIVYTTEVDQDVALVETEAGEDIVWIKTNEGGATDDDLAEIHQDISEETPQDSTFLTSASDQRFRLDTSRAMVVNWKGFPFKPQAMIEWGNRMNDVCSMSIEDNGYSHEECDENFNNMSEQEIKALSNKYDANWILTKNGSYSFDHQFSSGDYHVYKIN